MGYKNALSINDVRLIFIVKFLIVCIGIERKEKVLVVKLNNTNKHAYKKKGFNGKWVIDPLCMHVKNEIFYAVITTILQQFE